MNSNIIPQGPQETITDGAITHSAQVIFAETDLVITNLVYIFPANPANANVITGFTLKAGRYLFNVKSMTFTGTATVVYTGRTP